MADSDDEDLRADHEALMTSMTHPFEQILDADEYASHAALAQPYAPYVPISDGDKTREELLRDAFTDGTLRRMARKASGDSVTRKKRSSGEC